MKIALKAFSICDWTKDGSKAVIFQNYFFSIFQNCSITNVDGNYIFTKWCFGLKFNFPVLFTIGNFSTYFSRYALSGHTFSLFSVFNYSTILWKVFKFLWWQGVRKEKVRMYIYFNKGKAFRDNFSENG